MTKSIRNCTFKPVRSNSASDSKFGNFDTIRLHWKKTNDGKYILSNNSVSVVIMINIYCSVNIVQIPFLNEITRGIRNIMCWVKFCFEIDIISIAIVLLVPMHLGFDIILNIMTLVVAVSSERTNSNGGIKIRLIWNVFPNEKKPLNLFSMLITVIKQF